MAIKGILKMGNPVLTERSKEVDLSNSDYIERIIEDMTDTMKHYNGAGLAAPQIGYPLRIMMFGFDFNPRYPNEAPIPITILINPQMKIINDTLAEDWEGCLSVPGIRGKVPRYLGIEYTGVDENGNSITRKVENFHARVFQHEYDHLEGILFPARVKDFKNFGFEDELRNVIALKYRAGTKS